MLAYMRDSEASAAAAARYFLETRADVWTAWISDEVANRVRKALN
jgi:glycine betaine/proline transport system substrate-binding protein